MTTRQFVYIKIKMGSTHYSGVTWAVLSPTTGNMTTSLFRLVSKKTQLHITGPLRVYGFPWNWPGPHSNVHGLPVQVLLCTSIGSWRSWHNVGRELGRKHCWSPAHIWQDLLLPADHGRAVFTFFSLYAMQMNWTDVDKEPFYDQMQYAVAIRWPAWDKGQGHVNPRLSQKARSEGCFGAGSLSGKFVLQLGAFPTQPLCQV